MKVIVQNKYGSPDDVLELQDIDKPVVNDDECWYAFTRLSSMPMIAISGEACRTYSP